MTDELVHVAVDDAVATITLDSPANRNALSRQLVEDLNRALDVAEARVTDGSVRAIVLTHAPPAFCAGADLKERRTGPPDSSPMVRALRRLMDADVPTIAAVDGPARAGGIGLMASCDLVVVQQRPHVRVHRGPHRSGCGDHLRADPATGERQPAGRGVPHRRAVRRRLCPRRRAGHPRRGRRPGDGRLAVRRHPDGCPTSRRRDQADAAHGPRPRARRGVRTDAALSDEIFAGPDAAEGMAAFAEKRPPAWQRAEEASG